MTKLKRTNFPLLFSLIVLLLASWHVAAQTPDITLRVLAPEGAWYMPYVNRAIVAFEAEHPGVTVELATQAAPVLADAILTEYAAGMSNDVLLVGSIIDNTWRNVAAQGLVIDHFPLLEADPEIDADEFFPPVFEAFIHQDRLIGIPMEVTTAATFVNKTLFVERGLPLPAKGWTWRDMAGMARSLVRKDADGNVLQWGFGTDGFSLNYLGATPFMWSNEADIVNADRTRATLLDTDTQEALQFFYDIHFIDQVSAPPGSNQPGLFWQGDMALWDSASWNLAYNRQNALPSVDWDLVPPMSSPHTGKSAPLVSGHIASISASSQHPDLAWELIKFLFIDDDAQQAVAAEGMLPTRRAFAPYFLDVLETPPQNIQPMLDAAAFGRTPVWFDDPQVNHDVWDVLAQEWNLVLEQEQTVRSFAERVTPLIDALLQR